MKTIKIPNQEVGGKLDFEIEKNLIIVGANGSGKTRFGSMIEQWNNPTKRISAQRHLQLNEVVQKQDFDTADTQLKASYKNRPTVQPQDDYQQVLVSLFAQEARRDFEYVESSRLSKEKLEIPLSVKEAVVSIWNFVFPYRELRLDKDRVRTVSDDNEFSGSEMSDGEKVGLYLISQILLAEKDCTLIIDEPELHLHKALMVRLWNKLEEQRKDCTFIYITHDLDFAVSKPSSRIIWIKKYKSNQWEWTELLPNEVIPENLYLEVLGSRKPILFVEGEKGSLDIQLYQAIYEDFTVVPRGSCEKVIEAVKGLKDNENLHDKKVFGLIDRDFRPKEQIKALEADGVFCTTLNKVESLFLLPDVVQVVCDYLLKTEKKEEVISSIKKLYLENREGVFFSFAKYKIQRLLNEKFGAVKNKEDYLAFKASIFSETDGELAAIETQENNDIMEILKVYPHKGLVKQIQGVLDFKGSGYQSLVLNLIVSDKRDKILGAMKLHLPEISLTL